MSDVKRKLGWKNYRLFIVLVFVVVFVAALFAASIILISQNDESYTVAVGSVMLDKDYNIIDLVEEGNVKRGFNGNYVLETTNSEGTFVKYDLGKNSVSYSDRDYKFYLFGQAYLVSSDNSVRKVENYEEISKATPAFYKLDDRKYLLADKKIEAKDISLKTQGYLIVELDRQGNATMVNNEINLKTINPVIIKGTYYDFDVAHEKLIMGEREIDLTNIIGTTNEYEDAEEIVEEDKAATVGENNEDSDNGAIASGQSSLKYYDDYLKRIKNSFNNLYTGASRIDSALGVVEKKSDVALDLTRWTKLTSVTAEPTYIVVNYSVFDPNNEYEQVFIDVREYGNASSDRYILSKEESSYILRNLSPDRKYIIDYGYSLTNVANNSQADVVADSVVVVTAMPNMSVRISKITTNKLYYVLELDRGYEISQATIKLISDGEVIASVDYDYSMAHDFKYEGSFSFKALGNIVEVMVTDMMYNGTSFDGTVNEIYINK